MSKSSRSAAKTRIKPVGLSIAETAKRIGISAAVLRIWEHRYGWPIPERGVNGYRLYPPALIAILERVNTELKLGKTIGELMRDPWWQQVFTTGQLPKPPPRTPVEPPWSSLPMPTSALGLDVRQKLQQALVAADTRLVTWAQAMGQQLHPTEREKAVNAVLRLWDEHRSVEA